MESHHEVSNSILHYYLGSCVAVAMPLLRWCSWVRISHGSSELNLSPSIHPSVLCLTTANLLQFLKANTAFALIIVPDSTNSWMIRESKPFLLMRRSCSLVGAFVNTSMFSMIWFTLYKINVGLCSTTNKHPDSRLNGDTRDNRCCNLEQQTIFWRN